MNFIKDFIATYPGTFNLIMITIAFLSAIKTYTTMVERDKERKENIELKRKLGKI